MPLSWSWPCWGLSSKHAGAGWPLKWLMLMAGGAMLFTLYLKYLEFFVIHAICRRCVGSAVIIVTLFGLSVVEWRRARAEET